MSSAKHGPADELGGYPLAQLVCSELVCWRWRGHHHRRVVRRTRVAGQDRLGQRLGSHGGCTSSAWVSIRALTPSECMMNVQSASSASVNVRIVGRRRPTMPRYEIGRSRRRPARDAPRCCRRPRKSARLVRIEARDRHRCATGARQRGVTAPERFGGRRLWVRVQHRDGAAPRPAALGRGPSPSIDGDAAGAIATSARPRRRRWRSRPGTGGLATRDLRSGRQPFARHDPRAARRRSSDRTRPSGGGTRQAAAQAAARASSHPGAPAEIGDARARDRGSRPRGRAARPRRDRRAARSRRRRA